MALPRVYAVSPGEVAEADRQELAATVLALLQAGHLVQLREKHWSHAGRMEFLARLSERAAPADLGRLLVNADCAAALSVEAVGLQLPERSLRPAEARGKLGAGRLLGVSCHEERGLAQAAAAGADLATLSPIFPTPGKGAALGTELFQHLGTTATLPIYALGGIDESNAALVGASTSAHGIACIRAIFAADSPVDAAARLEQLFLKARAEKEARL